jgi:AraC family transcriptional regulator, transcriptional activator of pobA
LDKNQTLFKTLMKKITNFEGLYGESTARHNTNYIFSELLETRSRTFNWVINPHIHTNLYQIFFIATGQVVFKEAAGENRIEAPCILMIPPTSLHGLSYSPDVTGRILTLADSVVENLLPPSSAMSLVFNQNQCLTLFDNQYSFTFVISLIEQLDAELFNDRPEKQALIQVFLHHLFIVLYRILKLKEEEAGIKNESATLKYFRQFQKSIKAADYDKNIPAFAQDLGITPVHLNRVCQAVVGKSALELVQEHLIQEAQKYLRYTSYSVSEIAYLLKFEYPNYFARLFKKHTGLSPTAFREQR